MMQRRLGSGRACTFAVLSAVALSTGAAGGGCSGGGGPGAPDGGSDPTGGCTAADCRYLAAPAFPTVCPDGTNAGPALCVREARGQCTWGFPACGDAGQPCPTVDCLVLCPAGVLTDSNGCATCQCAPADAGGTGADAGGVCVSQQGGRCGGNTAHPCTCASGLVCTPGDGGLPFGDVGGTCE